MTDDNGRTAPKPQETYDEAKARAVKALIDLGCSEDDATKIIDQAIDSKYGPTSDPRAVRYITAEGMTHDDFGEAFTMAPGELVYDARTRYGDQWATMTHESWLQHRATDRLGTGYGQRYKRQANGQLIKISG